VKRFVQHPSNFIELVSLYAEVNRFDTSNLWPAFASQSSFQGNAGWIEVGPFDPGELQEGRNWAR
jgi:hypothetical protein